MAIPHKNENTIVCKYIIWEFLIYCNLITMESFNREVFSSSPDNIISSLFKLLSLFPQTATFTSYTAWSTLASLVWNSKRTFLWLDIVLKQLSFWAIGTFLNTNQVDKMYFNQNSNFRSALQLVGICLCVADISWDMPFVSHIWYVFWQGRHCTLA